MTNNIYYFLQAGEPKENESRLKYSDMFSSVGLANITSVTYGRIKKRDSFIVLQEVLEKEGRVVLLIPSILDMFNALSYDGVEFALRMYFGFIEKGKADFQIVILGTEEESAFWRHCKYCQFLKCPHVSYSIDNIFSIKDVLQNLYDIADTEWEMDWTECREAIISLNIKPPASYKTHHSITNEWSIYRWSKYLGIEDIPIKKDIEDFLFFNYLKAVYPESKINKHNFFIEGEGRVLLVDDECEKGWDYFFYNFFRLNKKIKFASIGSDFKKQSPEYIEEETLRKVHEFEPTIVILDLRLHDNDYDADSPQKLIGAKILSRIKNEINKGIQIIVFSASNKVWNYLPLASDGVIVKESPEMSVGKKYTQESIFNLKSTIEESLKKNYLCEFYKTISVIKEYILKSPYLNEDDATITDFVVSLDIAFDLMSKGNISSEYNAYAYLQLFQIIEKYVNLDTVFSKTDDGLYLCGIGNRYRILKDKTQDERTKTFTWNSVVCFADKKYYVLERGKFKARFLETSFLVSTLQIFKFAEKGTTKEWIVINSIRNGIAHTKENAKQKDVKSSDLKKILDFMIFFFNEENAMWRAPDDAFADLTAEEQMARLKSHFGA